MADYGRIIRYDNRLDEHELREKYDYWGSHPACPVQGWRHEVGEDNTRQGYWAWVVGDLERLMEELNEEEETQDLAEEAR